MRTRMGRLSLVIVLIGLLVGGAVAWWFFKAWGRVGSSITARKEKTGMSIVWTDPAQHVIQLSREEAGRLNASSISPGHILLGLLRVPGDYGSSILRALGVNATELAHDVEAISTYHTSLQSDEGSLPFSGESERILATAQRCLPEQQYVGTEHILYALILENESGLDHVLRRHNVTPERFMRAFAGEMNQSVAQDLRCEICGKPATIHVNICRDGTTQSHHYCGRCAPD